MALTDIMFRIQARLDVLQRLGDFDAHAGVIRELYEIVGLIVRHEMEEDQRIEAIHRQLSVLLTELHKPNPPNVMTPPQAPSDAQGHPVPPPPPTAPLDPLPGMQAAPQPSPGNPSGGV